MSTTDWLGLTEEELKVETDRGNAEVTLAVYDYSDVGPKEAMDLGTHVACVITPIGDRPPLAWVLAVAMAMVTDEAGNGIVIDNYLIWTKSDSDAQRAACEPLERRAQRRGLLAPEHHTLCRLASVILGGVRRRSKRTEPFDRFVRV